MIKENFIKLFESSFKENWDSMAMTDYVTKRDYTYKQVAEEVAKLHLLYKELNITKDDKIAIVGRNTPMWAISFISVVTYGAVVVPILQDFHPNDIQHIVNDSDAALLFLSDNLWENIEEGKVSKLRAILSITEFRCLYQSSGESIESKVKHLDDLFAKKYPNGFGKEDVKYVEKDNSEVVEINYTSGSTGFSKGVMLTGNNLAGNIVFGMNYTDITGATGKKKIVTFLPLAHAYGCAFDFLAQITTGSHITFLNRVPSPKILLKAFEEVKPDVIFTVPLVVEKVYKNQILPTLSKTSMKLALEIPILNQKIYSEIRKQLYNAFGGKFSEMVVGGASFNKEVEDFLVKIKFPFTVGYGMTECAPLISYASHETFVLGSAGRILPNMEVRIDSEDPANIAGEMQVRGDHVMVGYYKNQDATDAVFTSDGWLRTGDMGTVDKDGNIFIKGRCKNMILGASGQNVYPEIIEAKLVNMPFISECIVTSKDDKLVALVYPDFTAMDESHVSREELDVVMEETRKNLNKTLASYESITKIIIFPTEFEKTPKKNIKRYLYEGVK
ncbi:MAG: AMP-binding protein [Prevotellaceae bacterium]|nr:AMP-binding protein [Prevotellaceae bacterium]